MNGRSCGEYMPILLLPILFLFIVLWHEGQRRRESLVRKADRFWSHPCLDDKNSREVKRQSLWLMKYMNERNISYWIVDGALLGSVRIGDLLPWDYDVDIAMTREVHDHIHYIQRKKFGNSPLGRRVDLAAVEEKDGMYSRSLHDSIQRFDVSMIHPLKWCLFGGEQVRCPNDKIGFLEMTYGKGWRHSLPSKLDCYMKCLKPGIKNWITCYKVFFK